MLGFSVGIQIMQSVSDDFKSLLAALAESTGLDHLEVDEQGGCVLEFDERVTLYVVDLPEEGALRLVADLGVPDEDTVTRAFYAALLEANWLGTGTNGATLSLEPGTGGICLWQQVGKADLTPVKFMDLVGHFVDAAEGWMALIRGEAPPSEVTGGASSGLEHHGLGIQA